jgi:hypothetical protein
LLRKQFSHIKVWLFDFLARSNDHEKITLAVIVWHIWNARNAICNGETLPHPNSISMQINSYIEMILKHLFKPPTIRIREPSSVPVWVSQQEGVVVINVDAALFKDTARMGVGVVIRDHRGEFLSACNQVLDEVTLPEIAEALVIRCAVTLARG